MKKKIRYVVATVASLASFAASWWMVGALPVLDSWGAGAAFLRYLAVGKLLFPVAAIFLWLDEHAYIKYRPLLIAGGVASLVSSLRLLFSIFRLWQLSESVMLLGDHALVAGLVVSLSDLVFLLPLVFPFKNSVNTEVP